MSKLASKKWEDISEKSLKAILQIPTFNVHLIEICMTNLVEKKICDINQLPFCAKIRQWWFQNDDRFYTADLLNINQSKNRKKLSEVKYNSNDQYLIFDRCIKLRHR